MENNYLTSEDPKIDMLDLLMHFWQKKWFLTIALCLGILVTGLFTSLCVAPTYSSTSKLYVFSSGNGAIDLSELQLSSNLANDYLELIKSRPVVETVMSNLEKDYSYEYALSMLSVENPESTRFLNITVKSTDPQEARDMANEYASVTSNQIAAIMKQDKPSIVEKAVLPQRKSSPRTFRDAALGGFIVLFIAMFFCFIKYIFDDTIKNEDDIKKYLEINTLASIPALDSNKGGQKKSRLAFSKAGGRKKHGV